MNHALLEKMRNAYEYPPAKILSAPSAPKLLLAGHPYTVHDPFEHGWPKSKGDSTSWDLDDYHNRLLNSGEIDERFLGVLSVVYWGYRARSSGGANGYAEDRARWMLEGKGSGTRRKQPSEPRSVSSQVAQARKCLEDSSDGLQNAIQEIMEIAFIGFSFASKILTFMEPRRCAVLDSVLLNALQWSDDSTLKSISDTPDGYATWCRFCQEKADELNALGSKWRDWDAHDYAWRAVDVERAVFAYMGRPRNPADLFA